MITKIQVFGLLAAVITIAPSAAIAQEAPNPENQQSQVSETQTNVNQTPATPNNGVENAPGAAVNGVTRRKKKSILPGVAGAVLNGVTGNKKNIVPGVAGAVVDGIIRNNKKVVPGVGNAVNSVTNSITNQEQNNTDTGNIPQAQQQSNSLPKTHLCNAKVGVDMSVQNLNPLNIVSGVTDVARNILGGKQESPNKLRANGDLGCLPR
ncbi:MAG: hypothetical protein QNJ51_07170 [Calothrix sp. MO_167.B12]|nr:hypothetical protein [Calothrix sp. MO_167.B12]